jgi:F-type H+-transporting ATPase subunit a
VGAKEAPRFFPLVGALFLYILSMNLFGLLPGMLPPTEVFSNNLAMALVVFLVFNWAGFTRNGFAYVKHLWGPIWWLGFLLFPIELLGLFIRPFSLTVRLTANMFADHLVAGTFRDIALDFVGPIAAAVVPVPLYFLGFFVCCVQAFVFSILTTVYVGLSTVDMKHGHSDGHDPTGPDHPDHRVGQSPSHHQEHA